jgi:hypothetical protein
MPRHLAASTLCALIGILGCSPAAEPPRPAVGRDEAQLVELDAGFEVRLGDTPYAAFGLPRIEGVGDPSVELAEVEGGWHRVRMRWHLETAVQQDDLAIPFEIRLQPDFQWMPHLAPEVGYVAAQHVFRSPAIIVAEGARTLVIVPDLDICGRSPDAPWYLDYDAPNRTAALGMSLTSIPTHVLYRKAPGMELAAGTVELGFYVTAYEDEAEPRNPWSRASHLLWDRWARPLYRAGEPNRVPMGRYVQRTYDWAFGTWGDSVWQEFELDGRRVGAPQFIVNVTQSPNYPGEWEQREFLSIWNQAWFSSLRSASGVMRWARRRGSEDLAERARLTKALALSAPMSNGIFPSVIRTDNREVTIGGEVLRRPEPWSEAYWTNSNRNPENFGVTTDWYHVLDASWTALLMVRWYAELEPDEELLEFARTYGDRLIALQDDRGFFPAWLDPQTQAPAEVYRDSPESSMSVTFLLELADATGEARYRRAGLQAMNAVLAGPVPEGRWEDFETYWSCNRFGQDTLVGHRVDRNGMFKQNTFSMFWTAEALLASWQASGEARYLAWGRRVLDELSMAQQVWQPPFIYVPALGGFGVMNADAEWNDSRQSLFAELFMDYYRATGDPHLFERGVTALKASFTMMYAPENPLAKEQWEKAHPFFGPEDYGFTMENYGHDGTTSPDGVGIGVFTIYDWGNGAASEAFNRTTDHYGDVYIDRRRDEGFGLDSIAVERVAEGFELRDLADLGAARDVRVVFEDGSEQIVNLDRAVLVQP